MKKNHLPFCLVLFFALSTCSFPQSNWSMQLDGVDDYLISGPDIFSNADLGQGSLAAWFKTSAIVTMNLFPSP